MRETREVRVRFSGDIDVAKSHLGYARVLLGKLKEAMKPGGVHHLTRTYDTPDGVRVSVDSKFGQDTVSIHAPTEGISQSEVSYEKFESPPPKFEDPIPPRDDKYTPPNVDIPGAEFTKEDVELPTLTSTEEFKKKEEEEESELLPYLWVGARIKWDGLSPNDAPPADALILLVEEPNGNGCVITSEVNFVRWGPVVGPWAISLRHAAVNNAPNQQFLDLGIQDAAWDTEQSWVAKDRRQYEAFDNTPNGQTCGVRFTRHLLRHYDWTDSHPTKPDDDVIVRELFDPLANPGDAGRRYFPASNWYGSNWASEKPLWDQVVVLDPYEGILDPTDHRKFVDRGRNVLEKMTNAYGVSQVLDGNYRIYVGIKDQVFGGCNASTAAAPYQYGWNDELTAGLPPCTIEIEVRLCKDPSMRLVRHEVTLGNYRGNAAAITPFGWHKSDRPCLNSTGPNPKGGNWWSGVILADVKKGALGVQDPEIPAKISPSHPYTPVFAHGAPVGIYCARQVWVIAVQVFQPWSEYAYMDYAAEVARQIIVLFDNVREHAGGAADLSIPRRSYGDVYGAALKVMTPNGGAGSGGEGLYEYDVETCVFVPVALKPGWGDLLYNGWEFPGYSYVWEYEYRWEILRSGRLLGKVKLGMGDPLIDRAAQSYDPPDIQARCILPTIAVG